MVSTAFILLISLMWLISLMLYFNQMHDDMFASDSFLFWKWHADTKFTIFGLVSCGIFLIPFYIAIGILIPVAFMFAGLHSLFKKIIFKN